MTAISMPLTNAAGHDQGTLVVAELPNGSPFAQSDASVLREGQQYRYNVQGDFSISEIEPAELFEPDDETLLSGRVNPGLAVGQIALTVRTTDETTLTATLEVAPTKLNQTKEYRRMLEDITNHSAEAVLQGFAPSHIQGAGASGSSDLLYQRFAVLASRLQSDEFAAAIGRILSSPHSEWLSSTEQSVPGAAFPSGSSFGRILAAPGPRRPWLSGRGRAVLETLPANLIRTRHEASIDTPPNRFIKYALESWRATSQQLKDTLASSGSEAQPGPVRRGQRVADEALEVLDEVLGNPFFRQVGSLDRFPGSNQVLLKREGYRQLLHMFAVIEAGLDLPWRPDTEDIYSPSLRNVADLYEIWTYLTLVEIVGQICGQPKIAHAFVASSRGLSLHLKSGEQSRLSWKTVRSGRQLEVSLLFNHQFSPGRGSWTAAMRPDCSIRIRPLTPKSRPFSDDLDIWVHFDAKYRVSGGYPLDLADDGENPIARGTAKREDLLKMHAYRDAITRTAGAYILYPGDESLDRRQFTEMLPGLGAFPLRPGPTGAVGTEAISNFMVDVLDHVAEQASQHERARFWHGRIYTAPAQEHPRLPPTSFLERPPADTDVLLGYVRDPEHRAWIQRTRTYDISADEGAASLRLGNRELGSRFILLYETIANTSQAIGLARVEGWRAIDHHDLAASGYPQPDSNLYFVTELEEVSPMPVWIPRISINTLIATRHHPQQPISVTWLDLLSSVKP